MKHARQKMWQRKESRESLEAMDEETIKTQNPICRLFWCLIVFIDWRYNQSCWYFRPLLWTVAPLPSLFSLTSPARVWLWFNTQFLTRFRTYKIATPTQPKTPVKTTFRNCCLYSSFVMLEALSTWHIVWESERVRLSAISIALRGIDGAEETEWKSPFKGTVAWDGFLA